MRKILLLSLALVLICSLIAFGAIGKINNVKQSTSSKAPVAPEKIAKVQQSSEEPVKVVPMPNLGSVGQPAVATYHPSTTTISRTPTQLDPNIVPAANGKPAYKIVQEGKPEAPIYTPPTSAVNLLQEGFENGGAIPAGWADVPGTSPWHFVTGAVPHGPTGPHGGSYCAYFDIYNYPTGTTDSLITPAIDFSAHSGVYTVSFWSYETGGSDSAVVYLNEGAAPIRLGKVPYTAAWTQTVFTFNSTAAAGKIEFVGYSLYGVYNPTLDDISIDDAPSSGRCCYGDPYAPSCAENSQSECTGLGGTWYAGQVCAGNPCLPTLFHGDNCADPINVNIPANFPYSQTGLTTCGFTNDYAPTCLGNYGSGPDVVYQLNVTAATTVNFLVDGVGNTGGNAYTGIALFDDCPLTNCITFASASSGPVSFTYALEVGTYYLLVDNWAPGPDCINYDISLAAPAEAPANDECINAEPVSGPYPTTVFGTTLGATVDCPDLFIPAEECVWYAIDLPYAQNNLSIDFTPTCDVGDNFASVGIVYTNDCSCTAFNVLTYAWQICPNSNYNVLLTSTGSIAGPTTIYFPVYISPLMDFGFTVDVTEPTLIECPPVGTTPEGEPDCADNYIDVTNGGCNSVPFNYGSVADGEIICGTAGTFNYDSSDGVTYQFRDTDWYHFTLTENKIVHWKAAANFASLIFLLNDNCASIVSYASASAIAGDTAICQAMLAPGTYVAWVGPSVFTGIACGTEYVAWFTLENPPPPPANDLCADAIPVAIPSSTAGSTINGTIDVTPICNAYTPTSPGVWYTVAGNGDSLRATICATLPSWDTKMFVYCGDDCDQLICVTANDDACGGVLSQVDWQSENGNTYYVLVSGYSTNVGNFTLDVSDIGPGYGTPVSCVYVPPPPPDFVVTAPGTFTDGNTCGASDNCTLRVGPDQRWEITIPTDGQWVFSLCNSPTSWDSYIYLGTTLCSSNVGISDDDCGISYGLGMITATLTAGTYYLDVEGYTSADCGAYTLDINPPVPCVVTCPPAGIPEGEPLCGDQYIDTFNGGCNQVPELPFQDIALGTQICGQAGTFAYDSSDGNTYQYRDTDWYRVTLTEATSLHWKVVAEFPVLAFILNTDCAALTSYASGSTIACDTIEIAADLQPGDYCVWVGPSVFVDIPCGSDYVATAFTVTPPTPPSYGLAQTGNVPDVGVSNSCALGENAAQLNTFTWSGNAATDYAGTFAFGNSQTAVNWRYGANVQMLPPVPGDFDITDPFHPTASYTGTGDLAGLTVDYCGKGYVGAATDSGDVFLHTFTLTNNGTSTLDNVYGAVYMDWDIGSGGTNDSVYLDRPNQLVYQKGVGASNLYGLALVNTVNLRSLQGIAQDRYSYPNSGWLPDSLYNRMSLNGDEITHPDSALYADRDFGSLLSVGPFTLIPNGHETIIVAQIGAANVTDMVARATLARGLNNPCFAPPVGCPYILGDVNENGSPDAVDVTYAVNYLKGRATPHINCAIPCPGHGDPFFASGDVNGSCEFNGVDITFFVNYLKGRVDALRACPDCAPTGGLLVAPGTDRPTLAPKSIGTSNSQQ